MAMIEAARLVVGVTGMAPSLPLHFTHSTAAALGGVLLVAQRARALGGEPAVSSGGARNVPTPLAMIYIRGARVPLARARGRPLDDDHERGHLARVHVVRAPRLLRPADAPALLADLREGRPQRRD